MALRRRGNESAALEHLQQIRHARARRAEHLGKLARSQTVLALLDEEHEEIECPSGGACDRPSLSHGA